MDIRFDINQKKFQEAANKAPGILLKNMRLAMLVSCRKVQDTAQDKAVHLFRSRTGMLVAATEMSVTEGGDNGIEGRVFIDDSLVPYGKFVHEGTKPHIIRRKNKKVLRWPVEDGTGFRFAREVHHPGTKPDQFVYKAADMRRQYINDVFNRYTDRAIKEAGL